MAQSTSQKRFEVRVSDCSGMEKILGSTDSQAEFRQLIVKGLQCLSRIENAKSVRTIDFLTNKEGVAIKEQGGIKVYRAIEKGGNKKWQI